MNTHEKNTEQSRRRALLTIAAVALGATGVVAKARDGSPADAAIVLAPIQMNTGDGAAYTNTATARTILRADRGSVHTLTLLNVGASTTDTRGTLHAYLGPNETPPSTTHTSAVRGHNETTDPEGAGLSGEGARGVFGESKLIGGTGVMGFGDDGVGVLGFSARGVGMHGFGGDAGSVGIVAESVNVATALEVRGRAVMNGLVTVNGEVRANAENQLADATTLRVRNLNQGAGLLVSRSGDSGASRPDAGLSDGFVGILVDLVSSDLDLPQGVGVSAVTGTETAIRAESAAGTALEVHGPALFAGAAVFESAARFESPTALGRIGGIDGAAPVFENAGTATIAAGKAAVAVIDSKVKPGTNVIATLQGNGGIGVALKHVVVLDGRLRIVLTKKAVTPVKVAYFVLGEP